MTVLGILSSNNEISAMGTYDFPMVIKQNVTLRDLCMLGFSETRASDSKHKNATVHFFEADEKFDEVWNAPPRYILRLSQYRQVLSPDFSQFTDMPKAIQIFNVYRNRWCAAYWQKNGLVVIPTITWSNDDSLEYSFDAVQKGSCVAVSTLGCAGNYSAFMDGYKEMINRLEPMAVICYGKQFDDMQKYTNLIEIEYKANTRVSNIVKDHNG